MRHADNPMTVEEVAAALEANGGVIAYAARALGCSRNAVYAYIDRYPELEDVRRDAREAMLDTAEHHVITAVNEADMQTVRWVLDRLGRARGYSTRQEIAGVGDAPLTFAAIERVIVDPDPALIPDFTDEL